MTFMIRQQTRYRVELESYWRKTVIRKGIDSAVHEHGGSWSTLKNDMARQNIAILPTAQNHLAKYEPLAFRAVVELCASRIPPPQPPVAKSIPAEVYAPSRSSGDASTPCSVAVLELREKIADILGKKSTAVMQSTYGSDTERWLHAWQEFESIDASKRLTYQRRS
eukprot:CAMPEP_0176436920 /NCGR_PEP_ID=MMETSP0127-20121128/18282_1 /TAXON_ID=938130 /ORGANISM="Platyophrya macrostoma, Strain WH" /LENGTH=165 /DNA_ID=CAMNT_0017820385 /DNA_START=134 /DNA_END=631 /DNA_ORIENTATION=+